MKNVFLITICIILIFIPAYFQDMSKSTSDVSAIYVYHVFSCGYKIDFNEKKFYKSEVKYNDDDVSVIKNSENEEYQEVYDIETRKLNRFIIKAQMIGFLNWEDVYSNPCIQDGHMWRIIIIFKDGQEKIIWGSNSYPSEWDEMYEFFMELTGEKVLDFKTRPDLSTRLKYRKYYYKK